jgi:putative glutamine amidotransferase
MSTDHPRLGLTMRVVEAEAYVERRDALAHDWHHFMREALSGCAWMPLPNIGPSCVDLARSWSVRGLILTGGNDVGASAERDDTESALIGWALAERLPVFGVCRGLQMLQRYFGGPLSRCARADHVAATHPVEIVDSAVFGRTGTLTVNSFHEWSVDAGAVASPLKAFALAPDRSVEGAVAVEQRVIGVMWHPERERPCSAELTAAVRRLFGLPAHVEAASR